MNRGIHEYGSFRKAAAFFLQRVRLCKSPPLISSLTSLLFALTIPICSYSMLAFLDQTMTLRI